MFAHDKRTNTLRLQPGRHPPWIRKTVEQERLNAEESLKSWLYCPECKGRWCPDSAQRPKAHLPFRDRASQLNMWSQRPHQTGGAFPSSGGGTDATQNTQPEPEPEGDGGADALAGDIMAGDMGVPMEEDDDSEEPVLLPMQEPIPDLPNPAAYPTLEEYRAGWAEKLAAHAKFTSGGFSLANLVPKKIPNLWQDCRPLTCRVRRFSVPEVRARLNDHSATPTYA